MILRSSAGSVPSTASISVCFRNGSWMVCRSASSETTPVAARLVGKRDQLANQLRILLARRGKDVRQAAECRDHRGKRKLQQHRAHCAAKDDQRRGGLQNLAQVAAFDQQSGNNAGNGQKRSADARLIHVQLLDADSRIGCDSTARRQPIGFGFAGRSPAWPGNIQARQRRDALQIAKVVQAPRHHSQQPRAIGQHPLHHLADLFAHNQLFSIDQVSIVSGEASAVLIRSLFSTMGLPLSRVSSIMAVISFARVIGASEQRLKN